MYLWNDPDATIVRAAREANWSMPAHSIDVLEQAHGALEGQRVVVLGASYRGGVKETAFSGVFPVLDELQKRGAIVFVHDPMYSADELVALGFAPYQLGEPCDAAVLQADHAEYAHWSSVEMPGIRTILNGRQITLHQLKNSCLILNVDGS